MANIFVYEVGNDPTTKTFYAFLDKEQCARQAETRNGTTGERVEVREYERVSGGFVTLYVPHMPARGSRCATGYMSLGEAHDADEHDVHGYAIVDAQATAREKHAERVRMGWA